MLTLYPAPAVPAHPRLLDPLLYRGWHVEVAGDRLVATDPAGDGRVVIERHLCEWVSCVSARAEGSLAGRLDEVDREVRNYPPPAALQSWWNDLAHPAAVASKFFALNRAC